MKTKQSKTKTRTKAGRTASLRCDALVRALTKAEHDFQRVASHHAVVILSGDEQEINWSLNMASYRKGIRDGMRSAVKLCPNAEVQRRPASEPSTTCDDHGRSL